MSIRKILKEEKKEIENALRKKDYNTAEALVLRLKDDYISASSLNSAEIDRIYGFVLHYQKRIEDVKEQNDKKIEEEKKKRLAFLLSVNRNNNFSYHSK